MGANDAIIFDAARVREFECMAPQAMMGTVSARDSTTALPICMPFLISGAFRLSAAVWGGRGGEGMLLTISAGCQCSGIVA
jgi:hypothetical protein